MATAIRYDTTAWASFTVLEAKRILAFLGLSAGGGLEALEQALPLRLYGFVNTQEVIRVDAHTLVLRMNDCRVQSARSRRGLPAFPCKSVGEVEYAEFARPRNRPPHRHPLPGLPARPPPPGLLLRLGVLAAGRGGPKVADPLGSAPARAANPDTGGLGGGPTVPRARWRLRGAHGAWAGSATTGYRGRGRPVPGRRFGRVGEGEGEGCAAAGSGESARRSPPWARASTREMVRPTPDPDDRRCRFARGRTVRRCAPGRRRRARRRCR